MLYTGLGEKDKAIEQLNKAYEDRTGWVILLKVERNELTGFLDTVAFLTTNHSRSPSADRSLYYLPLRFIN